MTLKSACKPVVWRDQVASLTLPLRAAGRNSAMQADKSVFCAQALGANQAVTSNAVMPANRSMAWGLDVDGGVVMLKIP